MIHEFEVEAKVLRSLRLFVSEDKFRASMMGLRVEPAEEGAVVVGTDGKSIGMYCLRGIKLAAAFTIPLELLQAFFLCDVSASQRVMVLFDDESKEVSLTPRGGASVLMKEPSLPFPDWRKCVLDCFQTSGNGCAPELLGALLGKFCEASSILAPNSAMRFQCPNDLDAVRIVFVGEENFTGLLMPMRSRGGTTEIDAPTWIRGLRPMKDYQVT